MDGAFENAPLRPLGAAAIVGWRNGALFACSATMAAGDACQRAAAA